jgi:hypothetical protein
MSNELVVREPNPLHCSLANRLSVGRAYFAEGASCLSPTADPPPSRVARLREVASRLDHTGCCLCSSYSELSTVLDAVAHRDVVAERGRVTRDF